MLKQNTSLKQQQKLSPQQIQLMKLLQVPTVMLDQRIQEELEANPALEDAKDELNNQEEDKDNNDLEYSEESTNTDDKELFEEETPELQEEPPLEEYLEEYMNDDTPNYSLSVNNYSADQEEKTIPIAVESSFQEHMESQIGLLSLNEKDEQIAFQIIGSIDEDGYLRRAPAALTDDLAFSQNIMSTEEEVRRILKLVQQFEPAGIAAESLQECLLFQIERRLQSNDIKENYTEEEYKALKLAHTIIERYFDEFSKKHYSKLLKQLNLFREDLQAATNEILKLNPKPGNNYAPSSKISKQYIVPDFIIENKTGDLELHLNTKNAPELRINTQYQNMLSAYSVNKKDKQQKAAALFVKQKIDAARWFIDAIKQRHQTMFKTMYSIMQYQYDFFLTGDEKKLKPMILKDIADITGLDISTISRVANSKYVQTEFGTKLLKSFFSESLTTSSGEEVSTIEVKKNLSEIIEHENKRKPYSDEKLKTILQEKGYNIARRTVAKYREQLGIPVARLRKEII